MKYKQFAFTIPVFNCYLLVHVGSGLELALNNFEKRCNLKLDTDYMSTIDFNDFAGCFIHPKLIHSGIIWLSRWKEEFLVHEAMHATAHFMQQQDAMLNDTSEELYAKLLTYIVIEIQQKFKQTKWKTYV